MGKDINSGSELKKMLVALPQLNFNDVVRRAFGAAKAPVKELLDSFADRFDYNKSLTQVRLKGVTTLRLRGKQRASSQAPATGTFGAAGSGGPRGVQNSGLSPLPHSGAGSRGVRKGPVRPAATTSARKAANVRSGASTNTGIRTGRFAANVTRGRRTRAGNR